MLTSRRAIPLLGQATPSLWRRLARLRCLGRASHRVAMAGPCLFESLEGRVLLSAGGSATTLLAVAGPFAQPTAVTAADATPTQAIFTIDPSQSSVTISGSNVLEAGDSLTGQNAGAGATVSFSGSLSADLLGNAASPNSIQFTGATLTANTNTGGNDRPGVGGAAGSAPANFGLALNPEGIMLAIRGFIASVSSAQIAVTNGSFATSGVSFNSTAGEADYVASLSGITASGSETLVGSSFAVVSAGNPSGVISSSVASPGTLTLSVPIDMTTTFTTPLGPATILLTGSMVGTYAGSHLAFTQQPSSAMIGDAVNPTVVVAVEDANGNAVSSDGSSVTLSIATGPAGGTLVGTTTVQAVGGLATFSGLALGQSGTYTLTATDETLISATSATFMISGVPTHLAFSQQPTGAGPGKTIAPAVTVDVEDASGNLVATDNSEITLAITPGTGPAGATLAGTTTVAAQNGVATFSDLSFPEAGTYTITASDGALTATTSASFAVALTGPNIVGLAANPQVTQGTPLTLTASGVTTLAPATVKAVDFYYDTLGTGVFTLGKDKLLGVGKPTASGIYALNLATGTLPVGSDGFFARLLDSKGQESPAVYGTVTILALPPTISKLTSTNKAVAADNAVTLSAIGVTDKYNKVASVTFYWSPSGATTTAGAIALGTATAKTGWKLTVTLSPATLSQLAFTNIGGTATFLAQAQDMSGTLGNIAVLNIPVVQPVIGSLTVPTDPIIPTAPISFTASDITDTGGTVKSVQFWLAPATPQSPGTTTFSTIADTLLGSATKSSGGNWVLTLKNLTKLNLAAGGYVIFARAMDKSGMWSEAVAQAVTLE